MPPRATFQGVPCLEAEYTNPQGTGSGSGFVVMTAEDFGALKIDGADTWSPLVPSSGGTVIRDERAGPAPALGAGLKIRGDLVLSRDGESVPLVGLYVTEAGVREISRSAEPAVDRGKVRVPLGDIRMLWNRGDMCGDYNMTRRGVAIRGFSTTVEREDAEGIGFLAESVRPDGKPYTLLDLVRICLRRLPGRLTLAGPAADLKAADEIIPVNVKCAGESALSVLNGLLGAWNFRFVLDLCGNQAQLWRFGEGRPEPVDDGGILKGLSFPTIAGSVKIDPAAVPARFRMRRYFYRPRAVRVVGRPIVREVRVEGLEPVGELPNGTIAPLEECLAAIQVPAAETNPKFTQNLSNPDDVEARPIPEKAALGKRRGPMTRADLAKWVLLNQDEQRAWRNGALTAGAVGELRRWGFKWFRLPQRAAPFTPVLPYRARALENGERIEPAVFADLFDEVPFESWGQKYAEAIASLRARRTAFLLGPGVDPNGAIDEVLDPGLFGFLSGGAHISPETRSKIVDEVLEQLDADDNAVRAQIASESRSIAECEGSEIRYFNLYHQKVNPAAYEVDPAGIVRFSRVVGAVQIARGRSTSTSSDKIFTGPIAPIGQAGAPRFPGTPVYVSEGASLDPNPRVAIVFAYESTPRARKALLTFGPGFKEDPSGDKTDDAYRDTYSFLGTLEGKGGKVTHLNPSGNEPANAADLFPRVVRHDLKLYVDVDGRSNEADLNAFARSIVRRELEGPDQMQGEDGEASTFYKLQPTGAVASITWALRPTQRGFLAKTRWNVGDETQIAPRGMTQTRSTGTAGLGTLPGGVTSSQENPR